MYTGGTGADDGQHANTWIERLDTMILTMIVMMIMIMMTIMMIKIIMK
jgi:hypothetical protein